MGDRLLGSEHEKQQPKHNPCRPEGRNWKEPIFIGSWSKWVNQDWSKLTTSSKAGKIRHLPTVCLTKVYTIGWNPNGIPTWSMENMKWYSLSQVLTANMCHVYPQLTATCILHITRTEFLQEVLKATKRGRLCAWMNGFTIVPQYQWFSGKTKTPYDIPALLCQSLMIYMI